jgi:hypothetical protein
MTRKDILFISKLTSEITHYFLFHHEKKIAVAIDLDDKQTNIIVTTPLLEEMVLEELKHHLFQPREHYTEFEGTSLGDGNGIEGLQMIGYSVDLASIEVIGQDLIIKMVRYHE